MNEGELSIASLAVQCQQETSKYYRTNMSDDRFCFELFRRALGERIEEAWEYIFLQYMPLVRGWVGKNPQFRLTGEEREFFVNRAFEQFWRAVHGEKFREKFGDIGDLKEVLAYLKMCSWTAVGEHATRRVRTEEVADSDLSEGERVTVSDTSQNPDRMVADAEEAAGIWQLVMDICKSEEERVVARCAFVYGMKPQAIYDEHRELFDSVQVVYRVKENLVARLRRDEGLKRMVGRGE